MKIILFYTSLLLILSSCSNSVKDNQSNDQPSLDIHDTITESNSKDSLSFHEEIIDSNEFNSKILAIMQTNVNVRSGESLDSEKITMLSQFDEVEIISRGKEEFIDGKKDYWYKIQVGPDVSGYIFGHFTSLKQEGRLSQILEYQGSEFGDLFHILFGGIDFGDANNNFSGYNLFDENDFTPNEEFIGRKFEVLTNNLIARKYCNYPENTDICIEEIPTIVSLKLLK